MAIPILATKLYIPPLSPKVVARPRLVKQLNEGLALGHKLTLISAPAGFGKSTLVSEWLARGRHPTAWLSLDENDNDPARFLIYLLSALQTVSPNLGAGTLDALQSSQPPPIESILTALLNEIVYTAADAVTLNLTKNCAHATYAKRISNPLPDRIHQLKQKRYTAR